MTRLRVVVVTPEAPDPFGNAAARWYYALAKGLVQRAHAPTFLSAYSLASREDSLQRAGRFFSTLGVPLHLYPYPIRSWSARKWNTLFRPYSFFASDELKRDLERSLREGYDVLNLEQMWTGYLNDGVKRAVLSVHHLELLDLAGVRSPSLRFLTSKYLMQKTERRLLARFTNIRVTTDRLRREVNKLNPKATIYTVPVAIDPDLYEFALCEGREKTVGLIASFNWSPGYNAAVRLLTRVWPRVKRAAPDTNLLIVGWNARRALASYLGGRDVTIVENVLDTKAYFRKLTVLAYPLSRGSGMKIKLLEAMAYGTPIVTTAEGAEGLSVVDGREAFIADDDDLIAERTVQLLSDRGLAEEMSRAARAKVESDYGSDPVVARMEGVYEDVLRGVC